VSIRSRILSACDFAFVSKRERTASHPSSGPAGIESMPTQTQVSVARAAVVAVLLASACARTPDDKRIRETIAQMQNAVEAGAPRDFMQSVSTDFTGNEGSVDHDGLANLVRIQALRSAHQGVLLGPIEVRLNGDRATADFTATLTGRSDGAIVPERASIFSITSSWRKQGADWRCYNAKWEQKL
jgi:hypothetical protein